MKRYKRIEYLYVGEEARQFARIRNHPDHEDGSVVWARGGPYGNFDIINRDDHLVERLEEEYQESFNS